MALVHFQTEGKITPGPEAAMRWPSASLTSSYWSLASPVGQASGDRGPADDAPWGTVSEKVRLMVAPWDV
jgi:hypothetical protein